MISAAKIRTVASNEVHCVNQWGNAFQPTYIKVARFVKELRAERVICLTATASPQVIQVICSAFAIDEDGVFRTTSYQPNLSLRAPSFEVQDEKLATMKVFLTQRKGLSVVYVQTHEQTEYGYA